MIRTSIAANFSSLNQYFSIIRNTENFLVSGLLTSGKDHDQVFKLPVPILITGSPEELVELSDAIIITADAVHFYDAMVKFLKKSRHVFVLSDSGLTFIKVRKLIKIAEEAGSVLYFYHKTIQAGIKPMLSAFIPSPEYLTVNSLINKNREPEHRDYIHDILLRELSLIFNLIPVNPRKIQATSVPNCSSNPELINVRLDFDNGSSALLTISSFTGEESRKAEIYYQSRMISYDLSRQSITMIDKDSPHIRVVRQAEIIEAEREEKIFHNFSRMVNKEIIPGSRFINGIAAHQTAAAIIEQILPSQPFTQALQKHSEPLGR